MAIKKARTYVRARREYGESFSCDICGKQNAASIALIEGARMAVCPTCSKFGRTLHSLDLEEHAVPHAPAGEEETEEIAEGYGRLIRQSREKLGLPVAVIAERIQERASYLEKIERGGLLPSLNVARKLEKELGIKLVEKARVTGRASSGRAKYEPPTLGDMLVEKKKKG